MTDSDDHDSTHEVERLSTTLEVASNLDGQFPALNTLANVSEAAGTATLGSAIEESNPFANSPLLGMMDDFCSITSSLGVISGAAELEFGTFGYMSGLADLIEDPSRLGIPNLGTNFDSLAGPRIAIPDDFSEAQDLSDLHSKSVRPAVHNDHRPQSPEELFDDLDLAPEELVSLCIQAGAFPQCDGCQEPFLPGKSHRLSDIDPEGDGELLCGRCRDSGRGFY